MSIAFLIFIQGLLQYSKLRDFVAVLLLNIGFCQKRSSIIEIFAVIPFIDLGFCGINDK